MLSPEPDYATALGFINHLSTDELRELMNHDDKLSNLVNNLPQMKALEAEKDNLLLSNKSLAEYNLSFDAKLVEAKNTLVTLHDQSTEMYERISNLKNDHDFSASKYTPETLQALLQTSSQELEDESEALVKNFLDGEKISEEFLQEYIPMKTKSHLRRIKAEKFKELMKKGAMQQSQTHSSYFGTPYPSSSPIMPLPGQNK